MEPQLDDWICWKERCARKLCSNDAQIRLGEFARRRFEIHLRRQRTQSNLRHEDMHVHTPSPDDAWHRFECYAALTQTRKGKRYKDWIFARVTSDTSSAQKVIEGGATLIIRNTVRTYLLDEVAPHLAVSLDQPAYGTDSTCTIGDLLPGEADPVDDVAAREYDAIAARHAQRLFDEMSDRDRSALLARFAGIPLGDPRILKAAGCKRSTFYRSTVTFLEELKAKITNEYGHEGGEARQAMTVLVLQHLEKRTFLWKSSDKSLPNPFSIIEEQVESDHGE